MSAAALPVPDDLLGIPTEPGEIDAGLRALWKENETATRASLMNLVIYGESADSLIANTETVRPLTLEHACRVILIEARDDSSDKRTDAWITAHCSLGPDGRKAVCCEQLAFRMHGVSPARLTNLLFANLESDLPLVLWWQASLSGAFEQRIYSRIDRLIIDSRNWDEPRSEFERLLTIFQDRAQHFIIHDLNWTRTFHLRLAIAAGFEDACALESLSQLEFIEIVHGPKCGMTARLLGGWMLGRLQKIFGLEAEIRFTAGEPASAGISQVHFRTAKGTLSFDRTEERFYAWKRDPHAAPRLFPADGDLLSELLTDQLGRGGNNAAYLRIVRRALTA